LLMAVAGLERDKEKYNLLQHPQLEIHDAIYFRVKLKDLWKALPQGVDLLEKEPIRVCKEEFGIDWHVPLKAEASAGFRFGVKVKVLGEKVKTTSEFLNKWCVKQREAAIELQKELRKLD